MTALRCLALTVMVMPAAVHAEATIYCNFATHGGKPFAELEFKMYSLSSFSERVRVTNAKNIKSHYETLEYYTPNKEHELFAFVLSKEKPLVAMELVIIDDVMDRSDGIERWPAIIYLKANKSHVLDGSCFAD